MRALTIIAVALTLCTAVDARTRPDTEYSRYRHEVDRLTAQTYRQHRAEIDPWRLRGHGFDLDHASPVKCGFVYRLPPAEVAAASNLRMIPSSQNRSEGARGCK